MSTLSAVVPGGKRVLLALARWWCSEDLAVRPTEKTLRGNALSTLACRQP